MDPTLPHGVCPTDKHSFRSLRIPFLSEKDSSPSLLPPVERYVGARLDGTQRNAASSSVSSIGEGAPPP
ncbi:hypothetical protein HM1_1470 [Heliomicrobium modesticaldum Ice1]|uniref:Uncharacterized protein n=1 Tax=Heliobacterium modesticaldum (strain ATCC 51547 / Ice1) TaxID=498761 RepID=B0TCL7_HELMI|nr:hypothetical protein HM1_1470 [Heliomicrobium modesticaldum Ice1]